MLNMMDSGSGKETLSTVDGELNKDESTTLPESGYGTGQLDSVPANNSVDASSTQPSSTQPSSTQPSSTEPSSAQTSSPRTSSAQPSSTQPSSAQTSYTQPSSAKPSSAQPLSTQPSSTQPSSTQTSSAKPSKFSPTHDLSPFVGSDCEAQGADDPTTDIYRSDHHIRQLQQSNTSGAIGTSMMRDSAVKELYEAVTTFVRWRLVIDIVQREYLAKSEGQKISWFRVKTQDLRPFVQDLRKLLYYLKLNLRHPDSCKDLVSRLKDSRQIDVKYKQTLDSWLNAANENVEEFARELECDTVKLLHDNEALLKAGKDEWLGLKNRREPSEHEQALFDLMAIVKDCHFLQTNGALGLGDNKLRTIFQVLECLETSDDFESLKKNAKRKGKFPQSLTQCIETWKARVEGQLSMEPGMAVSLVRGIIDQLLVYGEALGLSRLAQEAERAKLLDEKMVLSIKLIAEYRHKYTHSSGTNRLSTSDEHENFMAYVKHVDDIMDQLQSHFTNQGIDCSKITEDLEKRIQCCVENANQGHFRSAPDESPLTKLHALDAESVRNLSEVTSALLKAPSPDETVYRGYENLTQTLLHRSESEKMFFEQQGARPRSHGTTCREYKDGSRVSENDRDPDDEGERPGPSGNRQGITNSRRSNTSSRNSGDSNPTERRGGTTNDERNSTRSHQESQELHGGQMMKAAIQDQGNRIDRLELIAGKALALTMRGGSAMNKLYSVEEDLRLQKYSNALYSLAAVSNTVNYTISPALKKENLTQERLEGAKAGQSRKGLGNVKETGNAAREPDHVG